MAEIYRVIQKDGLKEPVPVTVCVCYPVEICETGRSLVQRRSAHCVSLSVIRCNNNPYT